MLCVTQSDVEDTCPEGWGAQQEMGVTKYLSSLYCHQVRAGFSAEAEAEERIKLSLS